MSTEAGAGGKFRKRPLRRATATPYNRPPEAVRLGIQGNSEDRRRGGWLARLVDPASRMIAGGATKLFSTVFRKRIEPSHSPSQQPQSEMDPESKTDTPDITLTVGPNTNNEGGKHEHTSVGNSATYEIFELEQLLKQKTYTRVEYEWLINLLRSRTVGLSNEGQKIESSHLKSDAIPSKEERASDINKENTTCMPKILDSTPKPRASFLDKKNEIWSPLSSSSAKSHSRLRPSLGVVQESEGTASPTELAKAYMGSRSSKHTSLNSQSVTHREYAASPNPHIWSKSPNILAGSRSSMKFAGVPENVLRTPRSQGRSALCKMSRSPLFNAKNVLSDKGRELLDEGFDGRSHLDQSDLSSSFGKQALKRRSSVLDGDIGHIRRIRQKSKLESSSKELVVSSTGRYLSSSNYGCRGSMAPNQKPSSSNSSKYNNVIEYTDTKDGEFSLVPHQSSKIASRILNLVDEISQPPKMKASELLIQAMEDSPPKLTFDMLNKRALESVKDIHSADLFNTQSNDKVNNSIGSVPSKGVDTCTLPSQMPEANGPTISASGGIKAGLEVNGPASTKTCILDSKYGSTMVSPSMVSLKKPGFRMQAPECSLELDVDCQSLENKPGSAPSEQKNLEEPSGKMNFASSQGMPLKTSFVSSPVSEPESGSISDKQGTQKLQVQVAKKDNGFAFPVLPSENPSTAPPTPSMTSTVLEKASLQREESVVPVNFEYERVSTSSSSLPTTSVIGSSGMDSGRCEASGSAVASAAPTQKLQSDLEVGEVDKLNEHPKSVGTCLKNIPMSTSQIFSSAPSSSNLSNGGLKMKSSALAVSADPNLEPSKTQFCPVVSNVGTLPSVKFSPAMPESTKLFSFASSAPASTTTATAVATDVYSTGNDSKDSDSKPSKSPTFGLNNFTSGASASFSNLGSSSFLFSSNSSHASTSGQIFGLQPSQAASATTVSAQTTGSIFSSLVPASATGSSGSAFGSSGFASSSSFSNSFQFAPSSGVAQTSSLFTSSASAPSLSSPSFAPASTGSSLFVSSGASSFASTVPATNLFSSASNSSFPVAPSVSTFSSAATQTSSIFGFGTSTSSQAATTPMFGSGSSPAVFSFTQSTTAPASSPVTFAASSSAPFSFTVPNAVTTSKPIFGMQTPVSFGSSSPGNDQMNVEDSMTEDTTPTAVPATPPFGLAANPPTFGLPSFPSGGFQFGGNQSAPAFSPAPSPFQAPSNLELAAGGTFSLGSGGGEKSTRRLVKVKRTGDKNRRK